MLAHTAAWLATRHVAVASAQPSSPATAGAPPAMSGVAANGTDLYVALQTYAQHARISLYIDPSTPHTLLTYHITGVSDQQAFDDLVQANGLATLRRGGLLYVGPPGALASRFGGTDASMVTLPVVGVSPAQLIPLLQRALPPGTVLFPNDQAHTLLVRGTPAALTQAQSLVAAASQPATVALAIPVEGGRTAESTLQALRVIDPPTPPNSVTTDPGTNRLMVRGTSEYVARVAHDAGILDLPVPQVDYSVSIAEVDPEKFDSNRGILFGGQSGPGSVVTANPIRSTVINATINDLESRGYARILERPTLVVLNGQTGTTNYTTQFPVLVANQLTGVSSVQTITTGVQLTLQPTVNGNSVTTNLATAYSDQVGTGAQGIPIVSTRQVQTPVRTEPDQAIVISGLYATTEQRTKTGIPPFDKWLLIGGLFKNNEQHVDHTEVVIVLEPHIVQPGQKGPSVAFPSIDPSLITHGIAPLAPPAAKTDQPTPSHPAPRPQPTTTTSTRDADRTLWGGAP